ncbi:hypothetical protein [Haloarchaeobius sp. TZWWS8]|uniref:hypothetical protein n=1 Tax=Haloarchaeobius sp. TZWWS8 TaxID=3446121 RepID=UPI003EB8F0F5
MSEKNSKQIAALDERLDRLEAENEALKQKLSEQSSSSWSSSTRRGMLAGLAGLGGAAALGAGASDPAAAATTDEPASDVQYIGNGDTIQAAIDDETGGWSNPVHIVVTPGYDSSAENFPIVVDRRAVIKGSVYSSIDNSDDTVNTIEINIGGAGSGTNNRPPGVVLKDLSINGGNHGIKLAEGRYCAFYNIDVNDVATDAYHFEDKANNVAVNTHRMIGCYSDSPGRYNVYCGSGVNDIMQVGCQHYYAGVRGVKVASGNYSSSMINSGVEQAQEYGLEINGVGFTVDGGYFENNYKGSTDAGADIQTSGGAEGFTIRNCYFNGWGNEKRAIRTFSGGSGVIESCSYRNYTTDFVFLDDSTDVDVRRSTHTALDSTSFGGASGSGATRPRSDGIIGANENGIDLSSVTGKYVGDVGLDDGTNTEYGDPDLCVWTGNAWRQTGTGTTF